MLIKLKRTRTHSEDRKLALWLATTAGLLNAIALGAFGFFPSHMSGNTSQLSSEVSSTDFRDILFFSTILSAFVGGAIIARLAVIFGLTNGNRMIFCHVIFLEGIALISLALYEIFNHHASSDREVITLLCFLMGIHNSTSTQLSSGRIRSTHITGTLTDAGISFASVIAAMLRRDASKDIDAHKSQFKTHLTTISSFLVGGIAGLVIFKWFSFKAMVGTGVVLIGVSFYSIVSVTFRAKRKGAGSRG